MKNVHQDTPKKRPYAIVDAAPLRDKSLSLKAKGLYALISFFIKTPGFKIKKFYLEQLNTDGRDSFHTAWKELINAGLLIMKKYPIKGGGFQYEYELLNEIMTKETEDSFEESFNNSEEELQDGGITGSTDFPYDQESESKIVFNSQNSLLNNLNSYLSKDNCKKGIKNNDGIENLSQNSFQFFIKTNYHSNELNFVTLKKHLCEKLEVTRLYTIANTKSISKQNIDELLDLMTEILLSTKKTIKISGEIIPCTILKERIYSITFEIMIGILDALHTMANSTITVKNPKKYFTAVLYNASINNGSLAASLDKRYLEQRDEYNDSYLDDLMQDDQFGIDNDSVGLTLKDLLDNVDITFDLTKNLLEANA